MGDDPEAAYLARCPQRGAQGKKLKRAGVAAALMILMDCKLAEQRGGYGIGPVPLLCLRQESAFDLCGAQTHISKDVARRIADHVDPRDSCYVICPCVA